MGFNVVKVGAPYDAVERLTLADIAPYDQDQTIMGFFSFDHLPAVATDFQTIWYWGDDPQAFYTDYIWIGIDDLGFIGLNVGGAVNTQTNFQLNDFGLRHWCYRRTGAVHDLFIDGEKVVTITRTTLLTGSTGFTTNGQPAFEYLGSDDFAVDMEDSSMYHTKTWNAALTDSEILAEMNSPDFATVRTNALWWDTPFATNLLDISGNGRDWADLNGPVTFTTGIMNQYGPTINGPGLEQTARPVTDESAYVQEAHLGGVTYDLFYRYKTKPQTDQNMISAFLVGDLSTYNLRTHVRTGTPGGQSNYLSLGGVGPNDAVMVPVFEDMTFLAGSPAPNIYFRAANQSGAVTPAQLSVSWLPGNTNIIGANKPMIINDSGNLPTIFVTGDGTPTVQQATHLNFMSRNQTVSARSPNGEGGDTIQSGPYLLENFFDSEIVYYDSQLNQVSVFSEPSGFIRIRANRIDTRFWYADFSNPTDVRIITGGGVQEPDIFSLIGTSGISAIASDNTSSVLYYAANVFNAPILRWDLVNDLALGTFLTNPVIGSLVSDMIVTSDDQVIIMFSAGTSGATVNRYNSAGVLIRSDFFDNGLTPGGTQARMSWGAFNTASDTYWVMTHHTVSGEQVTRWREVRVSDGTVLQNIFCPDYEALVYQGTPTLTPGKRFGPSFSCPMISTPPPGISPPNTDESIPGAPAGGTGGLYEIVYGNRKLNDTLWVAFPNTTTNVKKPNPTAQTGDIGE